MDKISHITDPLLSDIEEYLAARNMGETYFGKVACGNTMLVERLRNGGDVTRKTEAKIRGYMASNPVSDAPQREAS